MKITPLEIRQKSFEKKLRGYDKDEVDAFLVSMSQEWERILDDQKELRMKVESLQKEVQKMHDVESTLYKTLKTAEDTGAKVVHQANKTAELHMKETQMNADGILNESKSRARSMIEEAEMKSRLIIDEMEDHVRNLGQVYKQLENQKDSVLAELKNLSNDTLDRANKISAQSKSVDFEDLLRRTKSSADKDMGLETRPEAPKSKPAPEKTTESKNDDGVSPAKTESEPTSEQDKAGSFFDRLD